MDQIGIDFSDENMPFEKAVELYMTMFDVSAEEAEDYVLLERGVAQRLEVIEGQLSELV
jgi:hypothetical protein